MVDDHLDMAAGVQLEGWHCDGRPAVNVVNAVAVHFLGGAGRKIGFIFWFCRALAVVLSVGADGCEQSEWQQNEETGSIHEYHLSADSCIAGKSVEKRGLSLLQESSKLEEF